MNDVLKQLLLSPQAPAPQAGYTQPLIEALLAQPAPQPQQSSLPANFADQLMALLNPQTAQMAAPVVPAAAPLAMVQPMANVFAALQNMQMPAAQAQPASPMAQPAASPQPVAAAPQPSQMPPTPTASPQDIIGALIGNEAPAQAPVEDPSWYQRPQFMQYISDVLLGVASNPNWAQGIAQGIGTYDQRGVTAAQRQLDMQRFGLEKQKTEAEVLRAQSAAARDLAGADKDQASADLTRIDAQTADEMNRQQIEVEKARVAQLKADAAYKRAQQQAQATTDEFTDKNYATAYAQILDAESKLAEIASEDDPTYLFGADFATREKLNTISEKVARYTQMTGQTKAVLTKSKQQMEEGTLSRDEYLSRLQRASTVHGPDAIRSFLGVKNETTKP